MRASRILLAVGLSLSACDDTGGPEPGGPPTGTLVVSTFTAGGDPDADGFQLSVDDADTVALDPTGVAEVTLAAGSHMLQLVGVAEHCAVASGTSREVDVVPQGTTTVVFDIDCPAVSARITTTTIGMDIDTNGYRIAVDGLDRGAIPANGTLSMPLNPGSRTIALTGIIPSCTVDGQGMRTVNVVRREVPPIDFAVVCTATTGVIKVVFGVSGRDVIGSYEAMVDSSRFPAEPEQPVYLLDVPAGDHLVSLVAPSNCTVDRSSESVLVSAGGLSRDTVEVSFSVTCVRASRRGTVRIAAPTTGTISGSARYTVRHEHYGYWDYGGHRDDARQPAPERHPHRSGRAVRGVGGRPLLVLVSVDRHPRELLGWGLERSVLDRGW